VLSHFTVSTLAADVRLDMMTKMIDVGKQCHNSCSTSAIANKRCGALATPLHQAE